MSDGSNGSASALENLGFLTVHDVQNLKGAVQASTAVAARLEQATRAQAEATRKQTVAVDRLTDAVAKLTATLTANTMPDITPGGRKTKK